MRDCKMKQTRYFSTDSALVLIPEQFLNEALPDIQFIEDKAKITKLVHDFVKVTIALE